MVKDSESLCTKLATPITLIHYNLEELMREHSNLQKDKRFTEVLQDVDELTKILRSIQTHYSQPIA